MFRALWIYSELCGTIMSLKNCFRTLCNYSEHCETIPSFVKEFIVDSIDFSDRDSLSPSYSVSRAASNSDLLKFLTLWCNSVTLIKLSVSAKVCITPNELSGLISLANCIIPFRGSGSLGLDARFGCVSGIFHTSRVLNDVAENVWSTSDYIRCTNLNTHENRAQWTN